MSYGATYQAVPVSGEGEPASHELFLLVMALFTLGIEPLEEGGFNDYVELVEGVEKRTFCWLLKPKSRNGKHETGKLVNAWLDPERAWFKKNPEHIFSYLNGMARQAKHCSAELANSIPAGIVRRGDKVAIIPMDAPEEIQRALLAKIDS